MEEFILEFCLRYRDNTMLTKKIIKFIGSPPYLRTVPELPVEIKVTLIHNAAICVRKKYNPHLDWDGSNPAEAVAVWIPSEDYIEIM